MTLSGPESAAEKLASDRGDEAAQCTGEQDAAVANRRLAALYREESPKLVRLFVRRTRSEDEANDLVHDVFYRFARLRDYALGLEKPQAYLRRIASNLLKDRAKTAARQSASLHVPIEDHDLPALDQERALEARDMLRRLEAAVLRLKPKTRDIFLAHRVEGLSYAQIAQRTGLSVKGVEKQMSKAILQLDRLLQRDRP